MNKKLVSWSLIVLFGISIYTGLVQPAKEASSIVSSTQHWFSQVVGASSVEITEPSIFGVNTTLIYMTMREGGSQNDLWFNKSTDAGKTWVGITEIDTDFAGDPNDLDVVGDGGLSSGGIYVSYFGGTGTDDIKFARSVDGGSTWATTVANATGTMGTWNGIDAVDDNIIYMSSSETGANNDLYFLYSTNGGSSWTTVAVDFTNNVGQYNAIKQCRSDRIYISYYDATNGNLMLATSSNSGISWSKQTIVSTNDVGSYSDIDVICGASNSTDVLWISYKDVTANTIKVIRSNNGGSSFGLATTIPSSTPFFYTAISATSSSTAFITATSANLSSSPRLLFSFTTNSNGSWTTQYIEESDAVGTAVDAVDVDNIFIGHGVAEEPADTGVNMFFYKPDTKVVPTQVHDATSLNFPTMDSVGSSLIFMAWRDFGGTAGLYFSKSTNGGTVWSTPVNIDSSPATSGESPYLLAVNSTHIYITYYDGGGIGNLNFIKSIDGGNNWQTPVLIDGATGAIGENFLVQGMAIANGTHIYVAYQDITNSDLQLAISTNGGTSFSIQVVDDTIGSGNTGGIDVVAVGNNVHIFMTYTENSPAGQLTLARSQNSGLSFSFHSISGSAFPTTTIIDAIDQNNLWVSWSTGDAVRFGKSVDAGAGWTTGLIISGLTDFTARNSISMKAISTTQSYIVYGSSINGAIEIVHTTNSGSSWTRNVVDGLWDSGWYTSNHAINVITPSRVYVAYNRFDYSGVMFANVDLSADISPAGTPSVTSFGDSPDPVKVNRVISFVINWADSDDTQVKGHICKTDSITPSGTGGSCSDSSWSSSSSFTSSNPITLTYTTVLADLGTKNYFVFVCDNDSKCNTSNPSGTFTVILAAVAGDGVANADAQIFDEFAMLTPLIDKYALEVHHTNGIFRASCSLCASFDVNINNTSIEKVVIIFRPNMTDEYRREQINDENVEDSLMKFYFARPQTVPTVRIVQTYFVGIEDLTSKFDNPIIRFKKESDFDSSTVIIDEHRPQAKNEIETHLVPEEYYILEAENDAGEIRNIGEYQASILNGATFNIRLISFTGNLTSFSDVVKMSAFHNGTLVHYSYIDTSGETDSVQVYLLGSDGTIRLLDHFTSDIFSGQFNSAIPTVNYVIRFVVDRQDIISRVSIQATNFSQFGTIREEGLTFNNDIYIQELQSVNLNYTNTISHTIRVRLSTNSTTGGTIFCKCSSTNGYELKYNPSGTLTYRAGTNTLTTIAKVNGGNIKDVIVTYNATDTKVSIFINGTNKVLLDTAFSFDSSTFSFTIGANSTGLNKFNGTIYRLDAWRTNIRDITALGLSREAVRVDSIDNYTLTHILDQLNTSVSNSIWIVNSANALSPKTGEVKGLVSGSILKFTSGQIVYEPPLEILPSWFVAYRFMGIPVSIWGLLAFGGIFIQKDAPEIGAIVYGLVTAFMWYIGWFSSLEITTLDVVVPFIATMGFVGAIIVKRRRL